MTTGTYRTVCAVYTIDYILVFWLSFDPFSKPKHSILPQDSDIAAMLTAQRWSKSEFEASSAVAYTFQIHLQSIIWLGA